MRRSLIVKKMCEPTDESVIKDDHNRYDRSIFESKLVDIQCLLCEQSFVSNGDPESQTESLANQLQRHLLTAHRFLIADIDAIVDLSDYCQYWRNKFSQTDCQLTDYCAAINTNCGPYDCHDSEVYHMLGGDDQHFAEDHALRVRLKEERIKRVIDASDRERTDEQFSRSCIFCRKVFAGNRRVLIDHVNNDHNFSIGQPDNIVECGQLFDLLDRKLAELRCLFCERLFKSWPSLKEHMRKKGHKMLNPDNREYDKFYLINYLSPEKHWMQVKEEDDDDRYRQPLSASGCDNEIDDDDWSDWREEANSDGNCFCLFCRYSANVDELKRHLLSAHKFNLDYVIVEREFYDRIKLINYIRRSVSEKRCHRCRQVFKSDDELVVHLEFSEHSGELPDIDAWDSAEYLLPTLENDNLLCFLDDDDETEA